MEEEVLESLGLNKREIKVYLTLLGLGELSVIEISRKTKIGRTYTYEVLESLIAKGLVSFVIENKTKKFKAAEPEKIIHPLKEKEAAFMEILPDLKKMSQLSKTKEPSVEVFRGTRGVKAMANEILEMKKDYCVLSEDSTNKKLHLFLTHFFKAIEKENIHERQLIKKKAHLNIFESKNSTMRFLPENYSYRASTVIYGDRVVIIFCADPFLAIRIKSKDLAETYQNYFEIMWGFSKKE
jgi:HTH-type transcriptional regulator, sugar sensing transcriptional regulator